MTKASSRSPAGGEPTAGARALATARRWRGAGRRSRASSARSRAPGARSATSRVGSVPLAVEHDLRGEPARQARDEGELPGARRCSGRRAARARAARPPRARAAARRPPAQPSQWRGGRPAALRRAARRVARGSRAQARSRAAARTRARTSREREPAGHAARAGARSGPRAGGQGALVALRAGRAGTAPPRAGPPCRSPANRRRATASSGVTQACSACSSESAGANAGGSRAAKAVSSTSDERARPDAVQRRVERERVAVAERLDRHVRAGLLEQLAPRGRLRRLARLDPARHLLPEAAALRAAPQEQDPAVRRRPGRPRRCAGRAPATAPARRAERLGEVEREPVLDLVARPATGAAARARAPPRGSSRRGAGRRCRTARSRGSARGRARG